MLHDLPASLKRVPTTSDTEAPLMMPDGLAFVSFVSRAGTVVQGVLCFTEVGTRVLVCMGTVACGGPVIHHIE